MRGCGWALFLPAALVAAWLAGSRLAQGEGGNPALVEACRQLAQNQEALLRDVERIEKAASDIMEIRGLRASGEFVLNSEEKKMERQGRMDLHIFMERSRNDTLEVLDILDRVLDKQAFVDPLRKYFGKNLDETVQVAWQEASLERVVEDISDGYGVRLFVRGDVEQSRTMSLSGEMTLLSILLYMENIFDAKLVPIDGHLWFISVPRRPPPAPEPGK